MESNALAATLGLSSGSPLIVAALLVWVASMIAVPLIGLAGPARRPLAISAGVVGQVVLVLVVLMTTWRPDAIVRAVLIGPAVWWFAEFLGSRTGVPFGRYHYTGRLRPQIARVPLLIPLAWLMMMPTTWAVADVIAPDGGAIAQAAIAAAAFTAWDVYLDPHLVRWEFWEWDVDGIYLGIPLSNYVGWFLWSFAITLVVAPPSLAGTPLAAVYIATWLLQFLGHLFFWNGRTSAIAGFVAMGALSVPVLLLL